MSMQRVGDALPPRVSIRLRAWKNRPRLAGFHAPASALQRLVPTGCVAVDAGANRGLYTYWMSRRADRTLAFEPQPRLAAALAAARLPGVEVEAAALSDVDGSQTFWISEENDGESSFTHPVGTPIEVRTVTLDSLGLGDTVGFLKIDVEGHEGAVLDGGAETIRASRPNVLVELEQRHRGASIDDEVARLRDDLGLRFAWFHRHGRFHPIEGFRPEMQVGRRDRSDYVANFLFAATDLDP